MATTQGSTVREGSSTYLVTPRELLPMRIRPARPIDDDELFELCAQNRDLRIERTAEGELIIMPPTGGETGNINFKLIAKLGAWVERDGTGVGFDSSTGFILPNGAERAPDAAWVTRARWEALAPEQRRKFPPLVPDFVLELRSPSDRIADVKEKMEEYVAQGVRLAWLVDAEDRSVHVHRPDQPVEVVRDVVRGDPVLPGFELRLDDVL